MENIIFDFNAPNDRKNDAFESGSWWPTIDQNEEYNGAGMYYGSYFLGFFAGITVESDNVIIDLNGFEIKQSVEFYYMQRWFSAIELNNQLFEPGQGPGKWDGLFTIANNVEIKNGNIGLTSHFGIHGNYNKQIYIHDINIYHFDTHGIQLNGFEDLELSNLNIGPCSNNMNFYGEFGHAIIYLPRLRDVVAQAKKDGTILSMKFSNREKEITADELLEEFEQSLLYAWKFVVYGEKLDYNTATPNDIRIYERSIKTFVNPTGISYASVVEGIFLNKPRAKAFAYAYYTDEYSKDLVINNVNIFGLRHKMKESLGADILSVTSISAISSYIDYAQAFKDFDSDNVRANGEDYEYDGMIVQDVMFAIEEWDIDNWDLLNVQMTNVLDWVKGEKSLTELDDLTSLNITASHLQSFQTKCNSDVMSHSGKGIIGLRLEGIDNGQLSNIQIYDFEDYTGFGMACSRSEFSSAPIQIGFSGNMVQGLAVSTSKNIQFSDIQIRNLLSNYGDVFGFAVWTNNNLTITGNVEIANISAGQSVSKKDASTTFSYPNLQSEACAYRVLTSWSNEEAYNTVVNVADTASITSSNVVGHVDCFGIEDVKLKYLLMSNSGNSNHIVMYSIFALISVLIVIGTVSYKSSLKKEQHDASYQLLLPRKKYYGTI